MTSRRLDLEMHGTSLESEAKHSAPPTPPTNNDSRRASIDKERQRELFQRMLYNNSNRSESSSSLALNNKGSIHGAEDEAEDSHLEKSHSSTLERQIEAAVEWRNRVLWQSSRMINLNVDDTLPPHPNNNASEQAAAFSFSTSIFKLMKEPLFYKKKKLLLNPESLFVQLWNWLIVCVILLTLIVYPFAIAFLEETVLFVLDVVTLTIFAVDIFLTFITAYTMRNGEVISTHSEIARKYLTGWFLVDLIATFPFDLVFSYQKLGLTTIMFRLLKLLRIFRVFKVSKIVKFNVYFLGARISTTTSRILKLIVVILLVANLSGCVWFAIGTYEDSPYSWINRTFAGNPVNEMSIGMQYLVSIYWAFTTLTTVGYGDVTAQTSLEILWTLFVQMFGALFFSYTTASIISVLSQSEQAEQAYYDKITEVESFCKALGVHKNTARRLVLHYKKEWRKPMRRINWNSIMENIPEDLRFNVILDLFPRIGDVPLIARLNKENMPFAKRFVSFLEPLQFAKGEFIAREGDPVEKLFIIAKGDLQSVSQATQHRLAFRYAKFDTVGLASMFIFPQWFYSVKCTSQSQLWTISKTKVFELLSEFEDVEAIFREFALAHHNKVQNQWNLHLEKSGLNLAVDEDVNSEEDEKKSFKSFGDSLSQHKYPDRTFSKTRPSKLQRAQTAVFERHATRNNTPAADRSKSRERLLNPLERREDARIAHLEDVVTELDRKLDRLLLVVGQLAEKKSGSNDVQFLEDLGL